MYRARDGGSVARSRSRSCRTRSPGIPTGARASSRRRARLRRWPPQHRDGLRGRRVRRVGLDRDGARRGPHAAGPARLGRPRLPVARSRSVRKSPRALPRLMPRDRSPGLEAREPHAHRRTGSSRSWTSAWPSSGATLPWRGPPSPGSPRHAARHRPGNGRLHVARAGEPGCPSTFDPISSPSARSSTRWQRVSGRSSASGSRDARGDHARGAEGAGELNPTARRP